MEKLTDRQKLIIAGVVLALATIHFLPRFLSQFRTIRGGAATSATHNAPVPPGTTSPPSPPAPARPPEVLAAAKYGGIWVGNALMPDQNRCNIRLEIRLSDDVPKKLKGFEQKSCVPLQPLAGGRLQKGTIAEVIRSTAPVSAVMTGAVQDGGIAFTIDQTIGAPPDGCSLSGFSITDFGAGQVQAQWQEGTCPTGRMLLRKARG